MVYFDPMRKIIFLFLIGITIGGSAFLYADEMDAGPQKSGNAAQLVNVDTSRLGSRVDALERRVDELERSVRYQDSQIRNLDRTVDDIQRRHSR